jgi:hypothetical protein
LKKKKKENNTFFVVVINPLPHPSPANIVRIMAISLFTYLVYLLSLWQVETLLYKHLVIVVGPISTTPKVVVFSLLTIVPLFHVKVPKTFNR